ncbi:MAG: TatD family hydrolase [Oscillatoriales cyanobacterium SM2_1_8]|nr:TatD family hydrolase [Oscillatoriales cyanobacterium SM2_1_8]
MVSLVDTHVHVNFPELATDLAAVRQRWQANGVIRLVHSCVSPDEFATLQAVADRCPEVAISVGLHPLSTGGFWSETVGDRIQDLAQSDDRVVAIGETGLDFYKATNQAEQIAAFSRQIAIAQPLDLPLIIHCREAAAATREVLQGFPGAKGVLHCWAGTPAETAWFVEMGFYISFSGIVTFKSAKTLRESAAMVPRDRLLIETDCPYLAPVPHRGQRNEPAYVRWVAETLAQVRGEDLAELAAYTTANAYALFRLAT